MAKKIKWSIKTADSIMQRLPHLYEDNGNNGKWSYDYGVILKGFEKVYEQTGNHKYFSYIKENMDYFIKDDGLIKGYDLEDYNIDNINNGKLLFPLYKKTKMEKYKKAADLLFCQLQRHPRTSEGAFWHKKIYPYQIWLDGLYMGTPFYAEYQMTFENCNLEDVIHQFRVSYTHLLDKNTDLLYHAWDEKKIQPWANKQTGLSPNFWGRSIGWYLMAIIDTIEIIPDQTPGRDFLIEIFVRTLKALLKYQDEQSGVWYQVTDKLNEKGNYLEASCSSMYVYSMAKGIRLGILKSDEWKVQVIKSFNGLLNEFVLLTKEGWVNLNKCCQVAGLGGQSQRDGSYAYYISEPIICNDQKGLGAFLQACAEYEEVVGEV